MKPNPTILGLTWFALILLALAPSASAFYNPSSGRWFTRDPIGEPGFDVQYNGSSDLPSDLKPIYAYVANDPITKWDFLGLDDPGCDIGTLPNLPGVPGFLIPTPPILGVPPPPPPNLALILCQLRCCSDHDACFAAFGCDWRSWLLGIGPIAQLCSRCAGCNGGVVSCMAGCAVGGTGPANVATYFCPNGPLAGTTYNAYALIPATCWAPPVKPPQPVGWP